MNEMLQDSQPINEPTERTDSAPAPARRKSINGWVALLAILLVAGLIWVSMDLSQSAVSERAIPMRVENANTSPEVAAFAPDFSLTSLDGEQVRLSDYRGKPVILNFWATWCPPCRAEMPALEEIWQQYGEGGVVVLGVDQGESPELVAQFTREEIPVTFPILLDVDQSIGDGYWVRSLPSTFFIDTDGIIQEIRIGGPLSVSFIQERLAQLGE